MIFFQIMVFALMVWLAFDNLYLFYVAWGKIRGHKIIWLKNDSRVVKNFCYVDPWENLRAPNYGSDLLLLDNGEVLGGQFTHWKYVEQKLNNLADSC